LPCFLSRRSLPVDLVKLFLLKTSKSQFVVINNITFNEENYENIKKHFGIDLLYQLDVVFRTLQLLIEYHWNEMNLYREEELLKAEEAESDQRSHQHQQQQQSQQQRGGRKRSDSNSSNHGNNELIMWNLFDYEDYLTYHHKIGWNEANILRSSHGLSTGSGGAGVGRENGERGIASKNESETGNEESVTAAASRSLPLVEEKFKATMKLEDELDRQIASGQEK
jgi:hypothetical protein